MTQKASRKRRKERRRAAAPAPQRGYARGRAKDEEVRRSLKPLAPGERPVAVTAGAVAAMLLAVPPPPAPSWATRGKRGKYERADRPSAREFGRFAEAAAKRYPSVDVWA
ncbi:MAG TPA: hypothetical protein VE270_12640, partial [Thermoleophilaceae bacterium]|nr:hypothetical protein [Thermoleophilaceae bacterium]